MGKVKRVLANKKIDPLETNYVGIELCETVHFHMPGYRFELTVEQFEKFALIMASALANYVKMGRPKEDPDGFILLGDGYLPGNTVYNTRFEVEEQTIPSIHIHIRGLSLRQETRKFIEFAEVIEEAKKNLTT